MKRYGKPRRTYNAGNIAYDAQVKMHWTVVRIRIHMLQVEPK